MNEYQDLLITDVCEPFTVFSKRGREQTIRNRRWHGLSFCISGQITYTIQGRQYISEPNTAIYLPKGETYTLHGDQDGLFPVINFQAVDFPGDSIRAFHLKNPEGYLKACERLRRQFIFGNTRLQIFSQFYALLDRVIAENEPLHQLLQPAVEYLEQHFTDPGLSNADLAQQAGISEVYLRKLFLKQYRTTPRQYLLDLRIQRAKQLLTDTRSTVTQVAEACGFATVYHFCRVFKERTGATPTQYAQENTIAKI